MTSSPTHPDDGFFGVFFLPRTFFGLSPSIPITTVPLTVCPNCNKEIKTGKIIEQKQIVNNDDNTCVVRVDR
jgi:hypothetical protein